MLWSCCRFFTPFESVWVQGLCSRELQGLAFLDRLANRVKQNLNQITIRQQSTNEKQTSIPVTPRIIPFSKCFMTMVIVSKWGYSMLFPFQMAELHGGFPVYPTSYRNPASKVKHSGPICVTCQDPTLTLVRTLILIGFFWGGCCFFFWPFREVTHRNEGFGK